MSMPCTHSRFPAAYSAVWRGKGFSGFRFYVFFLQTQKTPLNFTAMEGARPLASEVIALLSELEADMSPMRPVQLRVA